MLGTANKYIFLLFISIGVLIGRAHAQGHVENGEVMLLVDSTLTLSAGLNSLVVAVRNDSDTTFEGSLNIKLPKGLDILGQTERKISLAAKKSWYISLKIRASSMSGLKAKQLIGILRNSSGEALFTKKIQINVPLFKSLKLFNESSFQTLKQVGDSVYIKIRVSNIGSTDESIKLLFSSPDRIGRSIFLEKSIQLASGGDTLISMAFVQEKYMLSRAHFTLRVNGLYENNDIFDQLTLTYSSLVSNRNFKDLNPNLQRSLSYSPNYIEWQTNNVLADRRTHFLRSEGKYALGRGTLSYSALMTKLDGLEKPLLNNSFLEYSQGKSAIAIGNFQENLEQSLFGRGIRYQHADTLKDIGYIVGAMERKSDLLGFYEHQNTGYSFFGKLQLGQFRPDRKYYEGQLIYDRNQLDSNVSVLWSNSFHIIPKRYQEFVQVKGFVAGAIQQYFGFGKNIGSVEPAVGLGLNVESRWRKMIFQSENFYSSAYYPGNKRGTIQFIQRVGKNWNKVMANFGFTYMKYAPDYFSVQFLNFQSEIARWEGNIYLPLSNFGSVSLTPSFNKDRTAMLTSFGQQDFHTQSWRLLSTWNARSRNLKQHLNLIAESAYLTNLSNDKSQFSYRADLTYHYQNFGVNATYQQGALQSSDLLSASFVTENQRDRFSLGARYDGKIGMNKFAWSSAIMLNSQLGYGKSYAGSFQLRYRVLANTEISAMVQLNYLQSIHSDAYLNQNSRIGVRQLFDYKKGPVQKRTSGDLHVFCYYDHNQNEVYDEGDEPASKYHFTVKDLLLYTDKSGKAKFKNLPYGQYGLFFPQKDHFMANNKTITIDQKQISVEIPLHRGGTLKSSINLSYIAGISMETNLNLDRFTLLAKNHVGKVFRIPSNIQGQFEWSLPEGVYEVVLDESSLGVNEIWEGEGVQVEIRSGVLNTIPDFVVKVKSKKIEVKRFGKG